MVVYHNELIFVYIEVIGAFSSLDGMALYGFEITFCLIH